MPITRISITLDGAGSVDDYKSIPRLVLETLYHVEYITLIELVLKLKRENPEIKNTKDSIIADHIANLVRDGMVACEIREP
jgi:hypothetical protein